MKQILLCCVLGFILTGCSKQENPETAQTSSESATQTEAEKPSYDEKLDMAAQAANDNELSTQQAKEHPPVHQSISIQQTKDFLSRIDKTLAKNSDVNLNFTPDVAAHSRAFNALNDEAEAIYGTNDLTNKYRYCVNAASTARQIWFNIYSKSSLPKEYLEKYKHDNQKQYQEFKEGCLEDVSGSVS